MSIKVTAISDLHCRIPNDYLKNEKADLLAIAGDVLMHGNAGEYGQFMNWLEGIRSNFKRIVFVSGNHDRFIEENEYMCRKEMEALDVNMLVDQEITLRFDDREIKVYGTPWIPNISKHSLNWAYEEFRGQKLAEKFDRIPEGLDLLITHSPPQYILDSIMYHGWKEKESDNWGSAELRYKLQTMAKPSRVHIFGHVHDCWKGKEWKEPGFSTQFYNVAVLDEDYNLAFEPRRFEL